LSSAAKAHVQKQALQGGGCMSFFDQIFGTEMPLAARFIIAFAVVLGLIALTAWLLRQFAGKRLPLPANGRGRQPRLGVLDAFAVDARRRLVLIRRDNVEHLIMIGGPNDLVIESQIIRAPIGQGAPVPAGTMAPRQQQAGQRAPQVPAPSAPAPIPAAAVPGPLPPPEPEPRLQAPVPPVAATPQAPAPAPQVPAPQAQPPQPPAAPAPAQPAAARPGEPRAERLSFGNPARTTNFYRAIMNREPGRTDEKPLPASERVAAERRAAEPAPEPPRPAATPVPKRGEVDPLFADIERKLDEALKRPAPSFGRSEPSRSEQPAPGRAPQAPAAESAPRPAQPTPAPAPAGGEASKSALDALEEEMASLLGRGFDRDDR